MPTCEACSQDNPEIAKFCLACGAALAAADRQTFEERRVVTVLFVDLVGSTSRAEKLDPEDVRAILDRYHSRVRDEIQRVGGAVEKFIGDAVMAVFGAPVAFGDDAERAVRAAFAVREAVADLNASDPELHLEVRIAVNTGEALVALGARPEQGEAMVAGDVVNTAARMQAHAPVNGILVGEETYLGTRSAIEFEQAEAVNAAGKALPIPAWIAVRVTTLAGERILSQVPMLGRERELGLLEGIWQSVVGERRTHLVTILGPPGIGKSRITSEFGRFVSEQGGRMLRGRSAPYGASTPYAAFSGQVKQVAGIFDSDSAEDAATKLDAAVADLLDAQEKDEMSSHLAALLSLPTASEAPDRQALFVAARRFVEQLAARQPILLVFEDLQWADASMLDLLDELAAVLRDTPVLLLANARPDLITERPTWGGGLPSYTSLPLEPLPTESAQLLAEELLGHRETDRIASLLEISEGNPLFIEELAASLAERPEADELPTTIRALIASRLDALPTPERALLLDASVVGRIFWDGSVGDGAERDVRALLGSLERRDLLRRESVSRLQGHEQYRFKHALIRDVAYQLLPRAARRSRHEAVARFLEEATVGGAVAAEAVADHWQEAGDPERAARYFVVAADDAGRGWAKDHAVALYRQALAVLPADSPDRREVGLKLAVAVQAVYHLGDVERLRDD
jgi:class 3 adenylate cyclase